MASGTSRARAINVAMAVCGVLLLGAASCPEQQPPPWNAKLWAGAPDRGGIRRAQSDEFIACTEPEFGNYFAAHYDALLDLQAILASCKQWGLADGLRVRAMIEHLKEMTHAVGPQAPVD